MGGENLVGFNRAVRTGEGGEIGADIDAFVPPIPHHVATTLTGKEPHCPLSPT